MPDGPRRATMKVRAAATLAGGPDDGTYPDDRPSRSHRPRRNSRARVAGETTHASRDPRAAGRKRRQPRRLARNRQAGSARLPAAARPPHRALIKRAALRNGVALAAQASSAACDRRRARSDGALIMGQCPESMSRNETVLLFASSGTPPPPIHSLAWAG